MDQPRSLPRKAWQHQLQKDWFYLERIDTDRDEAELWTLILDFQQPNPCRRFYAHLRAYPRPEGNN